MFLFARLVLAIWLTVCFGKESRRNTSRLWACKTVQFCFTRAIHRTYCMSLRREPSKRILRLFLFLCIKIRKKRPLDSVILDEGVADDILDDFHDFQRSYDWYVDRGTFLYVKSVGSFSAKFQDRQPWWRIKWYLQGEKNIGESFSVCGQTGISYSELHCTTLWWVNDVGLKVRNAHVGQIHKVLLFLFSLNPWLAEFHLCHVWIKYVMRHDVAEP